MLDLYVPENTPDTHLPNNTVNRLIECVSAGDVLNLESAIQMSVDNYLTSIEDYYLTKRKQLNEARMEYRKDISNKLAASEAMKK